MKLAATLTAISVASASAASSSVLLEDFSSPAQKWTQQNDPVMGGKSKGTFTIENNAGVFDGEVVDVPFLRAPGFIKVTSSSSQGFADASKCTALELTVRASDAYKGYRVSFSNAHAPGGKFFAYGYKTNFNPPVGQFGTVTLPFTSFSDYWDDASGDQIKTCQDDKKYCPTADTLKNMKTISVWGEGVAGKVHLEIQKIQATGCASSSLRGGKKTVEFVSKKKPFNSTCSGDVQANLRFNLTAAGKSAVNDLPFPVAAGESLGEAVCCDPNFAAFAEPRFVYARPDVNLFKVMEGKGENKTTTFYDSVCGIPLFVAPKGRTLAEFEADTTEHGWPSFREEELIKGNSRVDKDTGIVTSKCGTHLGSYLPDEKGPRWCLDLVCLGGKPNGAFAALA